MRPFKAGDHETAGGVREDSDGGRFVHDDGADAPRGSDLPALLAAVREVVVEVPGVIDGGGAGRGQGAELLVDALGEGDGGNPGQLLVAAKGGVAAGRRWEPSGVDAGIVAGPSVVILLWVKRSLALNSQWRLEDRGPCLLTYQDQARFGFAEAQGDRRFRRIAPTYLFGGLLISMGLLSLGAWWIDRKRQEMLWFGAFASI